MLPIDWNPGARQVRSFARMWLPLFVAVAGAMIWRRTGSINGAIAEWIGGGVLALACLSSELVARRVFVGLQVVAYPIGATVSFVGLAVLFYLVITPIGWGMRLAGRDPLQLGRTDRSSHWVQYNQVDDPERAFRQF